LSATNTKCKMLELGD